MKENNIRRFEFNHVIVIQSLKPEEKQTGEILYEDLLKRVSYKITFLKTSLQKPISKTAFFGVLETLKHNALQLNEIPFIHIDMHGSPEGLQLASGEIVSWASFTDAIREINRITKNNVLLSLATCYGAYILRTILASKAIPFFGFIGCWDQVYVPEVMANFQGYFEEMFLFSDIKAIDLDKAAKLLNEGLAGTYRYAFYTSEMIFDRVFLEYETALENPETFNTRKHDLMAEALKNFDVRNNMSLDKLELMVMEGLTVGRNKYRDEIKRKFMMEDEK
jgi:hypothetical protein